MGLSKQVNNLGLHTNEEEWEEERRREEKEEERRRKALTVSKKNLSLRSAVDPCRLVVDPRSLLRELLSPPAIRLQSFHIFERFPLQGSTNNKVCVRIRDGVRWH